MEKEWRFGFIRCFCTNESRSLMSAIYDERKDEDEFLYVTYSRENTFGCRLPLF
ncbi:hypothetical protein IC575_016631 [Cucumis melo]